MLSPLLGIVALVALVAIPIALRWYLARARPGYLAESAANTEVALASCWRTPTSSTRAQRSLTPPPLVVPSAPSLGSAVRYRRQVRSRSSSEPTSGLSVKKPSMPAARKTRISPGRSPGAVRGRCRLRNSAGRNWFSRRKVQPMHRQPGGVGVGDDGRRRARVPGGVRGIITFLQTPTPSAYSAISASPAAVARSAYVRGSPAAARS